MAVMLISYTSIIVFSFFFFAFKACNLKLKYWLVDLALYSLHKMHLGVFLLLSVEKKALQEKSPNWTGQFCRWGHWKDVGRKEDLQQN